MSACANRFQKLLDHGQIGTCEAGYSGKREEWPVLIDLPKVLARADSQTVVQFPLSHLMRVLFQGYDPAPLRKDGLFAGWLVLASVQQAAAPPPLL
jgi:hypothetical protein